MQWKFENTLGTILLSLLTVGTLAFPSAAPAGTLEYSVPGVVNSSAFGTVFLCANHSDTSNLGVHVDVYDGLGNLLGTSSIALPVLGSAAISTQGMGTLATQNMNLSFFQGSAKLTYDGKGIVCTAWVQSPSTAAGYVNGLPLIFKAKQK